MNKKTTTILFTIIIGIIIGGGSVYMLFTNEYIKRYVPDFTGEPKYYDVNINSSVSRSIEKAAPNVVGIINYSGQTQVGSGSGVVYKLTEEFAYIVTNQHVISDGDRYEILLNGQEGKVIEGELIGEDLITDLAVVRIKRGTINQKIDLSNSDELKIGDFVIAIGNPLGLYGSSTLGIISSTGRLVPIDINQDGDDDWYAQVLQTDAAINPGNSGGALVDLNGNLVGINSMKIASEHVEGIGFSIPTNLVHKITLDIERYGEVNRPYLGVRLVSLTNISKEEREKLNIEGIDHGVYIIDVIEQSSADLAGLEKGDIITFVDGDRIKDNSDFKLKLYSYNVGDVVQFKIIRNNEELQIEFKLESNITN